MPDYDNDANERHPLLPQRARRIPRWRRALQRLQTTPLLRWTLGALGTITLFTVLLTVWYQPDISIHFKHRWSSADYPPLLPAGTESIRVLHVSPGHGSQRIETHLETVAFTDKPSYTALSYTWGDSHVPTRLITVDDKSRAVSEHLWSALQSVRDPRDRLTLWVDAICIDQDAEEEKSQQVGLMSFIYSCADEVLVWLGHHQAPRWVENSRPTQWHGPWAEDLADRYWGSAAYWIYRLVHQEYWKRSWVVQELGMAKSVRVFFGKQNIPWAECMKLVNLYARKLDDPAAGRILRLEELRQSRFDGGEAYSLFNLLNSFRDSFCAVALDKVFAFVSMATHFGDSAVPAHYTLSKFEVYRDLTVVRNLSTVSSEEKKIEGVYFSGLVRPLLARKSATMRKSLMYFGAINDPHTYLYDGCGDGRVASCREDVNATLGLAVLDLTIWTWNWFSSWIFWPHHEAEAIWRPSLLESEAMWLPTEGSMVAINDPENIRVRAVRVGEIRRTGPSYHDFLAHPTVAEEWGSTVEKMFSRKDDIQRAKSQAQRLEALLGKPGDLTPQHVTPLLDDVGHSSAESRSNPHLFVGTNFVMGLAPEEARPGDVICQFWNSSASVLLRRESPGQEWRVVGRSAVITFIGDGVELIDPRIEWDQPGEKTRFFSHGNDDDNNDDVLVDLGFTLSQLTRLTFDTVLFPVRRSNDPNEDQYPLGWGV